MGSNLFFISRPGLLLAGPWPLREIVAIVSASHGRCAVLALHCMMSPREIHHQTCPVVLWPEDMTELGSDRAKDLGSGATDNMNLVDGSKGRHDFHLYLIPEPHAVGRSMRACTCREHVSVIPLLRAPPDVGGEYYAGLRILDRMWRHKSHSNIDFPSRTTPDDPSSATVQGPAVKHLSLAGHMRSRHPIPRASRKPVSQAFPGAHEPARKRPQFRENSSTSRSDDEMPTRIYQETLLPSQAPQPSASDETNAVTVCCFAHDSTVQGRSKPDDDDDDDDDNNSACEALPPGHALSHPVSSRPNK
nr:hypothetical protein CFP56_24546 [Quercus suber]